MKNNIMKKLMAILLCLTMLIPVITVEVFAAESSTSAAASSSAASATSNTASTTSGDKDDVWTALRPAYMATRFKSIDDRILGNDVIAPMECMLVKDGYALYADKMTGEVVVLKLDEPNAKGEYEKNDNGIYKYKGYFSTNPYNIGTSTSTSTGASTTESIKEQLYSQVIVNYTENNTDYQFYSFTDAAKNNQISLKTIRNGIRIEYTLGREQVEYLVPRLIRKEKLDALIEQISKNSTSPRDAKQFAAFYPLKDPNDETLPQKTIVEMKKDFPICEKFPVYVCEPHITPKELARLEKYIKLYTDYTFEQLDIDHAETEWETKDKVPPLFKLALEYTIDSLGLAVRCNAGNIRFDSSTYKLSSVILLPYAGAGNVNNTGYIFTPDGSGSLIKYEQIKGSNFTTKSTLYGQDYAFHTIAGKNKEAMRLPVFGAVEIVKDQYSTEEMVEKVDEDGNVSLVKEQVMHDLKIGYLAVIETGDSLAEITVNSGGTTHMFASVYTSFNPRPKDSYALTGGISVSDSNAMWTVESKRKYTGDYRLRYFIMTDEISYSEMADLYREYLIKNGSLTKLESTNDNIPLYVETLGALDSVTKVLGVPVDTQIALSSFGDTTSKLLENLKKDNVNNIKLKLSGWANGGLVATVPSKVEIEEVLGGEEGFKKLLEYAKNNNVTVYPDFDFAFAYKDESFDGFKSSDDLTKTIDERGALKKAYDPVTQSYQYVGLGVISPNVMSKFYDKTYNDYKKYNVGAISVGSLGDALVSDFNTEDTLHREDSKTLIKKLLDRIKNDNGKVMVSGGNAYVLPYVSDILDIPLDDSRYKYAGATIPFMGMVLHGYKEYSGTAINLAGDYQYTLLKTIENGASPYFVIALDNTAELKQKEEKYLSKYYSVRYNIWYNDIVNTYQILNNTLKDLKYTTIEKHEFVDNSNKVPKVTYANGTSIYLNYLLDEYAVKIGNYQVSIPAESFIKVTNVDNNEKVFSVVFEDGSKLYINGTDKEYEVKVDGKTIKVPAGNAEKVNASGNAIS
jgi:hypothetical protein